MFVPKTRTYRTRSVVKKEQYRSAQKVWIPEVVERIASFLPPNVIALSLRLVNKATAKLFSAPQHKWIVVSQGLPIHAYTAALHADAPHTWPFTRRRQFVCCAARSGNLEAVEAALESTGLNAEGWLLTAAAGAPLAPGRALALCKRLLDWGCPVGGRTAAAAAEVEWQRELQAQDMLSAAAGAGHADVVEWLLAPVPPLGGAWTDEAVYAAAETGHVALARLLLASCPEERKHELCVIELLKAAAQGYGLEEFERTHGDWLGGRRERLQADFREQRPDGFTVDFDKADLEALLAAAAGSPTPCWLGKLDALLWRHLGEVGAAWLAARPGTLSRVFGAAMSAPDGISRVGLLWEQRGWRPGDGLEAALAAAGARGDTAAVRYLFEQLGASADMHFKPRKVCYYEPSDALRLPAKRGHLQVLQLMAAHGVRCCDKPFRAVAVAAAAAGHLQLLRWHLGQGALFKSDIEAGGEVRSDSDIEEYGPVDNIDDVVDKVLQAALRAGHADVVRYALVEERAEPLWPPTMWMQAATARSVALLELLASLGYPAGTVVEVYEAAGDDVPVLRVLARLRFCGSDAHHALIALLEDPGVPLAELRWLLEGDPPGACAPGAASASAAATVAAGPSRPSGSGQPGHKAVFPGPAARRLLQDEAQWQRAMEAVRGRGRGREAREVRAWLEYWRRELQGHKW
ncbi:hypothetical protein HXX76_015685 [Chlamydomonas incerta]|uniref:Ankyrin repeat domain-containing protein n=1 Tax=Chlamydomonas incerta TaxID=51695 RepID=A0A835S9R1_CHLIN|nr:hypothetical protein HXX76_015685 [Chlamydomonas incerta]|eukprot:KAG2422934.1 hypothetical protein HXX76_015685 [Chlamydomonas incerta]